MANTHMLIASTTLSSSAATIDFNSIPGTYTDLLVKLSGRSSTGFNAADTYIQFNGSTTSYSGRYLMKDSSDSVPVTSTSATNKLLLGFVPATQAVANAFGSMDIYIPNYTTSASKAVHVESNTANNGVIQWLYFAHGLWANSSAITQITLSDASGTFASGTTAYLYGIKNS